MKMVTYNQIIGHFLDLKRNDKDFLLTEKELEKECKNLFLKHSKEWTIVNGKWFRKDLLK